MNQFENELVAIEESIKSGNLTFGLKTLYNSLAFIERFGLSTLVNEAINNMNIDERNFDLLMGVLIGTASFKEQIPGRDVLVERLKIRSMEMDIFSPEMFQDLE